METTPRRTERPAPPPLPVPRRVVRKSQEEDFEATLGSLVNYYATLPPGAFEAEVLENAPAPAAEKPAPHAVTAAPSRRVWTWVVGGASSMVLGGVVTFALIVGRPDFWRLAENESAVTPAPPRIAVGQVRHPVVVPVSAAVVPVSVGAELGHGAVGAGVPRAEPLVAAVPPVANPAPALASALVATLGEYSVSGAKPAGSAIAGTGSVGATGSVGKEAKEPRGLVSARRRSAEAATVSQQRAVAQEPAGENSAVRKPSAVSAADKAGKRAGGDEWDDPYK